MLGSPFTQQLMLSRSRKTGAVTVVALKQLDDVVHEGNDDANTCSAGHCDTCGCTDTPVDVMISGLYSQPVEC